MQGNLRAMAGLTGDFGIAAMKLKMLCTMASPNPVPPDALERDGSTRKKRSKTLGSASAGMPTPVSETSMRIVAASLRGRQRHGSAGRRVCHGVRDQVAHRPQHQRAIQFAQ